jgi:hypothetical protein
MQHLDTAVSQRVISISGVATRVEDALRIAHTLDRDPLAQKLERAVAHHNSIVTLTLEDRQRLLDNLESQPGFAELRIALRSQIERYAQHQQRAEKMRRAGKMLERRNTNSL